MTTTVHVLSDDELSSRTDVLASCTDPHPHDGVARRVRTSFAHRGRFYVEGDILVFPAPTEELVSA
jgi:hypothetical protein